ncbi:MAG TPA: MarR family transcriptional regulator [Clostridia bacterium]|nr:MAG: Transcriptional repressor MprA [Firmicutes bacterium ADurb.Bin146]HOD92406.1 MarR family transcriptional regulator [Clostridia bacterium]HQM38763.1 MarR family transcriptional regulator [Clostridia bacterium]
MTKIVQLNEALLNAIHKFMIILRRKKMSADIVFHEFLLLRNILRLQTDKKSSVNPSDLSDNLNLSRSYVTSVLNSLEKKNLILRSVDIDDRRRIVVEITEKGRRIFDDMAIKELQQIDLLVKALNNENTLNLILLLNRASEILEKGE